MKNIQDFFKRLKPNATNTDMYEDDDTVIDKVESDTPQEYGAVYKTFIGNVRQTNEDYLLCDLDRNLYVVCDGMGGHNAGEVASKIAVDTISGYFTDEILANTENIEGTLKEALELANTKIKEQSVAISEFNGMGSTGTICYIKDDVLYVSNVGDSRAYSIRNGEIKQLTVDHSMAADIIEIMTRENPSGEIMDVRKHAYKNRLTSVLGVYDEIPKFGPDPGSGSISLKKDDIFVISSDGMWETMSDNEIRDIIIGNQFLNDAVSKLLTKALENGGRDNITIILYRKS